MSKRNRRLSESCSILALIAMASPAMGQSATGQSPPKLPPVTVTQEKPTVPKKKASAPKKENAPKQESAPKQASTPKKTPAPEPAEPVASSPAAPSDSGEPSLGLPPISKTSYVLGISKSELSSSQAANPSSTTVIRYSEETTRLVRDYQSLLKPIAGVSANDFDQNGVGFGLTLRGFSSRSNGSNVAIYIDGVPVNQASHRSSNGNGDLSPLIPELVDSFELTRGPFDVRVGPHALAGSAHYTTADDPTPGILAKGGSFGYARGAAIYGFEGGEVKGYGSLVASTQNGYRDNTNWDQYNTFNKFLFPMLDGVASLRFQIYDSGFESPGFLNKTLIQNGTISEKQARNPTDGGFDKLQNLVFNYKEKSDQPFTATAYVVHNDYQRIASRAGAGAFPDPTIPLTTAAQLAAPGLQFVTEDDRIQYGGKIEKYLRSDLPAGMGIDLLVGTGIAVDDVESNDFRSVAGKKTFLNVICTVGAAQNAATGLCPTLASPRTNALVDFTLANPFAYIQSNFKPVSWLKLTGGLRYDQMYFDIEDHTNPALTNKVSADFGVLQPKAGITVTPFTGFDVFANYGEGFRPPSVIGNQLLRDPNTPESLLATKELGFQYNSPDHIWHFLASRYHTTFTNEITVNASTLLPLSLGPSIREGYDIEGRVLAYQNRRTALSLYASYSPVTKSALVNQASGTNIPDIAEFFVKYGFDLTVPIGGESSPHLLTLSVGQVWEGPRELNANPNLAFDPATSAANKALLLANGPFRTETYSRIDAGLTYTNTDWKGFSVFVDGTFYPDKRLEETAFNFTNRVGTSAKAPVAIQGGVFIPF